MVLGAIRWRRPTKNLQLANDLAWKNCPLRRDQQAERSSFPKSFGRKAEVTGGIW